MSEDRADSMDPPGEALPTALDAAWRDFMAALDQKYPATTWPADRLRDVRRKLVDDADREAEAGRASDLAGLEKEVSSHFQTAAEMRAEAAIAGVALATRGDPATQGDIEMMMHAFGRVVSGEGPERRIVTVRGPDGGKVDAVLTDEESDRVGVVFWELAAKYVRPHLTGDAVHQQLTHAIGEDATRAELEHGIDAQSPEHGPDIDFDR